VRLSAKVLEWSGQTNLDYGFSIAYNRSADYPNNVVGQYVDGRDPLNNPAGYASFPSQSPWDMGLRVFLDRMDVHNGSVESVIEALEQRGDVEMLAEPTIMLKKGSAPATVRTGTRLPYAAEQVAGVGVVEVTLFQDTGVVLTVNFTDVVELDDKYARMKVTADVTSLAGYVSVAVDANGRPRQAPQTSSRHIESTILVRDKTTLIAGILKEDAKASTEQGPPILGDIPLLKRLFRNRSSVAKTHEILFLINVELVPPGTV
jgi:type II secretory pathway component GspD/PulD (secretin)